MEQIGFQVNGVADIALGDLYYIPYHLEIMDLSVPYTSQCLTFLTVGILRHPF